MKRGDATGQGTHDYCNGGRLMSPAIDGPEQFERASPEHSQQRYVLKLYVSGATRRSLAAVEWAKSICETAFAGRCQLEIVDIFHQPGRAGRDQVIAVPMLVKEQPLPIRRLVGTLSNPKQVLQALGLTGLG
jgi:circadian clock protein KaiB